MLLHIDSAVTKAKSVLIKAGGKDYFAKQDMGLSVGMDIDAEIEKTDYQGKEYWWIKKYKKIENQPHADAARAATPSGPMNLPYMPFVSNTIAHAIAAGCIKEPVQIAPWVKACIDSIRNVDTPF